MVDATKPKRTRTNVKQSKFGCFTCKARRIKCDEGKPACQRCLISKRKCQGYPRGAYSDSDSTESTALSLVSASSSPSDSSSPSSAAVISTLRSLAFNPYSLSSPFVDLGCTVLVQSPRRARNNVEQTFWSRTVPQLAQSIPSVRAAIEAFGTSYSEYVLRGTSPRPGFETTKRYSQALRMVQQDLVTLPNGPIPCVVACLFLGFVEALQQRLNKALVHLQGTFSLMMSLTDKQLLAEVDTDSLVLLLQKLDLHVATYAVSHPPNLPMKPFVMGDILQSYPPDGSLLKILHSSYHFTAKAFRYKYTSRRTIPPELLIEQGQQLANLKQWLSLNEIPSTSSTESHESLIVLRSQCLAALVNTATIMEPRETAYDCYGPEFEEIITSIGALLLSKSLKGAPTQSSSTSLPSFVPEMGIIHPLYFTAKKYRSPFWRRKALSLILKSGKEGPWCAETEGSLVAAIINAEEGSFNKESLSLGHTLDHSPACMPEEQRFGQVWASDPESENGECVGM
ncbi:transcriptional regulatory [Fusarium mundagurra]|uniref:Transcriptional regulatory n=1 Tax=Fusarium mundagurra TaxID=1567541 RepID=A0A8H6DJB5_9HYPO|nr:transcriptional regulatory [Fusarium mundagurra]